MGMFIGVVSVSIVSINRSGTFLHRPSPYAAIFQAQILRFHPERLFLSRNACSDLQKYCDSREPVFCFPNRSPLRNSKLLFYFHINLIFLQNEIKRNKTVKFIPFIRFSRLHGESGMASKRSLAPEFLESLDPASGHSRSTRKIRISICGNLRFQFRHPSIEFHSAKAVKAAHAEYRANTLGKST